LFVIVFTTPDFYDSWKYIPLLTIGVIFSNISALVGTNFLATKESKYYFYSTIWGGVVSVLFNFLLIPYVKVWGACIAIVLSHLTAATTRIIYSWKYNKITNVHIYILMIFIAIAVVFVSMIESLAIKVVAFTVSLLLIAFLNRSEVEFIANKIKLFGK
jgi:O-antigen/teichoic acid export membrane protein